MPLDAATKDLAVERHGELSKASGDAYANLAVQLFLRSFLRSRRGNLRSPKKAYASRVRPRNEERQGYLNVILGYISTTSIACANR